MNNPKTKIQIHFSNIFFLLKTTQAIKLWTNYMTYDRIRREEHFGDVVCYNSFLGHYPN
jgi:hypothetical protein